VVVLLDGESPEAALIQMPATGRMVMRLPALPVRVRQPAQEGSHLVVRFWPQHKMPVIGHQAERQQSDGVLDQGFAEDALEGLVVALLVEEHLSADTPVEGVLNIAARGTAPMSGQARQVTDGFPLSSREKGPRPLFSRVCSSVWFEDYAEYPLFPDLFPGRRAAPVPGPPTDSGPAA